MFISLDDLVKKYNLNITGILHIGAHECEELEAYNKYLTNDKIVWIEAIPEKVVYCKNNFDGILIEQAVISDKIEDVIFNVSDNGQSSSILNLGEIHKYFYPQTHYIGSFPVKTITARKIISKYNIPFNFVNLDIQGTELKALKGMSEYLFSCIEYIYTEINTNYVYENCCLVGELDEYLGMYGFVRVETYIHENQDWGDAFYIKKNIK